VPPFFRYGWSASRVAFISIDRVLIAVNFTPQLILRMVGTQRARSFCEFFIKRQLKTRHATWSEHEEALVTTYLHDISTTTPSGEYALNGLLLPIAYIDAVSNRALMSVFARDPLHDKMAHMGIPTLLLYGETDWLKYKAVEGDVAAWQAQGGDIVYKVIEKAGHHVAWDNSDGFRKAVLEFCK
jgi:cardiolipin-specific phospholipase